MLLFQFLFSRHIAFLL